MSKDSVELNDARRRVKFLEAKILDAALERGFSSPACSRSNGSSVASEQGNVSDPSRSWSVGSGNSRSSSTQSLRKRLEVEEATFSSDMVDLKTICVNAELNAQRAASVAAMEERARKRTEEAIRKEQQRFDLEQAEARKTEAARVWRAICRTRDEERAKSRSTIEHTVKRLRAQAEAAEAAMVEKAVQDYRAEWELNTEERVMEATQQVRLESETKKNDALASVKAEMEKKAAVDAAMIGDIAVSAESQM